MPDQKPQAALAPEQVVKRRALILNTISTMRADLLKTLFDPRRDLDQECGYPTEPSIAQYHNMYERMGTARRVVNCLPEESWALPPEVYEQEEEESTPFEDGWQELQERLNINYYLQRVDELSGVGRFGILLLGLDDGRDLSEPAQGVDETGQKQGNAANGLLFLRTFDESVVTVATRETDIKNPRFGQPLMYTVTYQDQGAGAESIMRNVHWSRVIHVADLRTMSEVFGTPRMKPVFDRLMDMRKILGGSAEMFWRGAFPGYSFEVNPDLKDAELDADAMREEFENYSNGLQRYMALTGVSAKSLAPQVADPENHLMAQREEIAVTLGIPKRIFMGSEEAKLASSQDADTWIKRVNRRQEQYLTPMLVRPFVDRLIQLGVLPEPTEKGSTGLYRFKVEWPDMALPDKMEEADLAVKQTDALAKYVAGNVQTLIPPLEYLTQVLGMSPDEATAVLEAAEKQAKEQEAEMAAKQAELDAQAAEEAKVAAAGGVPNAGRIPPQPGKAPVAKAPGQPAPVRPAPAPGPGVPAAKV